MYDTPSILVIFGSILFALAVLGGGISVKEIQIPSIQPYVRIFLFPVSIIFIVAGVWLSRQSPLTSVIPASVTPMVQPTSKTENIAPQPVLATEMPSNDRFTCKVLSDDFSQTSAWGDEKLDWGSWSHENGEYKVSLYGPNSLVKKCNFCDSFYQKDFQISINARTPQPKGSWGVYFWGKDNIQYSFELDKDGNALIKQYDGFDSIVLGSQHTGLLTTNRLTVEYFNGSLSAYVNGKQALDVSIASVPVTGKYDIGLIQTSFSSDSSEVFYDDFNFSGCP